jgi:uncharacterized OB-fold protein
MPYDKPVPKLNADNRLFWEGCLKHELRFERCNNCGYVRWPPSYLCPWCHSTETNCMISKGIGRIYTFAVYHTAFHPGFAADLPYTVAVVVLDEGPHILTNIVGCQPDKVRCEMPVGVVWEDVDERITLPKFRPLSREQA